MSDVGDSEQTLPDEVQIHKREELSPELITILQKILITIDEEGVTSDPNDASAYYLVDRLTDCGDIVKKFVENWQDHHFDDFLNGGNHRLYYLAKLHEKYGDEPISSVVREKGLLSKFRDAQMRNGRLRVAEDMHHGLGFRGLIAIAPESEAARDAIGNIIHRYEPGKANRNVNDKVSYTSALGLLEYDFEQYQNIINAVSERSNSHLEKVADSENNWDSCSPAEVLLLEKNPLFDSRHSEEALSIQYENTIEESEVGFDLGYDSETGIALLATGHGPTTSAYLADWKTEIRGQQKKQQLPDFVSTQPTTAVENRRTTIKQRMERMINETDDSLYVSTRGIGMLHHDLLDLLEGEPNLDFRMLTNRKKARGDRKKFKRAAMNELVERTDGGVKESELLHARTVISDQKRLLVSNADFTRDQLYDSFNAGLYTEHPQSVNQAVAMFKTAWEDADYRGT